VIRKLKNMLITKDFNKTFILNYHALNCLRAALSLR